MRKSLLLLGMLALILPLLFLGCGDNGSDGSNGLTSLTSTSTEPAGSNCANGGQKIDTGLDENRNGVLDPGEVTSTSYVCNGTSASQAKAESCSICHGGNPERDGAGHQAIYDMYTDASNFAVTIDDVTSVVDNAAAGTYNVTLTVTIQQPIGTGIENATLQSRTLLRQKRFVVTSYDNTTMQFFDPVSFDYATATEIGPGQFTMVAEGVPYQPETSNSFVYIYLANDELPTESVGRSHYYLPNNVINIGETFGDVSYESAANVAGCEKCHGKPYRKHGYRMAEVTGLPDFVACKACHYDDRVGEDFTFQILADNPKLWNQIKTAYDASDLEDKEWRDFMTAEELARYGYTANVMNDTHMSHAMELPYPQSMSNCATCHEGKLGMILTDEKFTVQTCRSCHPLTGGKDDPLLDPATGEPKLDREGNLIYSINTIDPAYIKQAPPLGNILPIPGTIAAHNYPFTAACNGCHNGGPNGFAPVFSAIHNGYDKKIYSVTAGVATKYATAITVSIDNASFNSTTNVLSFGFSSAGAAGGLSASNIDPYLMVGLYGYNTKDFLIGPHDTDKAGNRHQLEHSAEEPNSAGRFTLVETSPGKWTATADLSYWSAQIGDNVVRAEVAVLPSLEDASGELVGLNAPSKTFNLVTNAFEPNFFGNSIVGVSMQDGADGNVDGCNACHDQLATTFHEPDRGGNIVVCRMCHQIRSGGSHLEGQSRSIDSYVHAIHAFEVFDGENYDFKADPVDEAIYKLHIEHTYPRFTLLDCESCHIGKAVDPYPAIRFNVPDQSKSLPGVLSGDSGPLNFDRNIGVIPSYITGPATRACGACHRVFAINADEGKGDAGELDSLFGHWQSFGTLVTVPPGDLDTIINALFSAL